MGGSHPGTSTKGQLPPVSFPNGGSKTLLEVPEFVIRTLGQHPDMYVGSVQGLTICDAIVEEGRTRLSANEEKTQHTLQEVIRKSPTIMGPVTIYGSTVLCAVYVRNGNGKLAYTEWDKITVKPAHDREYVVHSHIAAEYVGIEPTQLRILVSTGKVTPYKSPDLGAYIGFGINPKMRDLELFLLQDLNKLRTKLQTVGKI